MAKVGISTGSAANAGDGSTLRAGGNIINANFDEIYSYFGDGTNLTYTGGKWVSVSTGINTLGHVGIATTNPTDPLTVRGGANISGVITASRFSGIGSFTNLVSSGVGTFNGNLLVGAGVTLYANSGFVSATKYFGDGSSLLSVPSGLGTALSGDSSNPLNKIYYIDPTLGIGQTITVNPPDSSRIAFTNYPNIEVLDTFDLIVGDGDDFIPDILGIGTTGIGGVLSGDGGRVRADNYTNKSGAAPNFPEGVVLSGLSTVGILTGGTSIGATRFYGALTGDVTGTASSATAAATLNAGATGSDLTLTGNLNVNGNIDIGGLSANFADKTVGIASTSSPTDTTADGAGIQIYGATLDKTLLWEKESGCFERSVPDKMKGVFETVSAASTYSLPTGDLVLEMDLEAATTYTYFMPNVMGTGRGSNIGIVSFKNMPANAQNGTTVTLLMNQSSTANHGGGVGYANTVATNGIGATCTIIPKANGSAIAGISTRARVGGGTGAASSITLSPSKGDVDFISFFIHYNGGTNTDLNSYKVFATKNGGFNFGSVGI